LIWILAHFKYPKAMMIALLLVSPLPFLFSASTWIKWQLDPQYLYAIAQMSPLYQFFSNFSDPWSGAWAYVDSPFHYAIEQNQVHLSVWPLLLINSLVLSGSFNRAKS